MTIQADAALLVEWLRDRVIDDARGARIEDSAERPTDRFWLGRLAPEQIATVLAGARGQRLDPCSAGVRFQPSNWTWTANVSLRTWSRDKDAKVWRKSPVVETSFSIELDPSSSQTSSFGTDEIAEALGQAASGEHSARVDVEVEAEGSGRVATVTVVNTTDGKRPGFDPNLYEVELELEAGDVVPFVLDSLPDSFRFDRRVATQGINGGAIYEGGKLRTTDSVTVDTPRPEYWDTEIGPEPDLRFSRLAKGPRQPLRDLVDALQRWGESHWASTRLSERASKEGWSTEMRSEADAEAEKFRNEVERCEAGLVSLDDDEVRAAFEMTNEAFSHSGAPRGYESWRPFQLGFFLSALPSITNGSDPFRNTVDTLWFATGGGKTETYLALVVFACVLDRLRGKSQGITAWSRFPLRMLSLQQTQRFADALAGAELARRRRDIPGDPIALGFFVGRGGTPNQIRDDAGDGPANAGDPDMPNHYRVLLRCPFCHNPDLRMEFDRRAWRLIHVCDDSSCPWPESALPFFEVDEEIYRFLPSVVVGTLDKAAMLGMQAAMRGFFASPIAKCSMDGHGFTYARRSSRPNGCLVPGCSGDSTTISQERSMFAPALRVQDELHLLRDSLGGVDSHYETLLDHLQSSADGSAAAKVLASSATLAGYAEQVETLYGRIGAVFPQPGPAQGISFWTKAQDELARQFVGLAPRGQTLEFANDRITETVQSAVRALHDDPKAVAAEVGVPNDAVDQLVSNYGTNVIYGTRIRDVEAAARSVQNQTQISPLHQVTLTGSTQLDEVRDTLERLERPEPRFEDRVHAVCASSMMSHGVDIDRLNVITMLGLPLTTAEFIQTTARIGRRLPGLVFVLHRMGVERDSSIYRSFDPYVRQGDRFIAPIAITRKSRRILRRSFPGMFVARMLGIHEARQMLAGKKGLVMARQLRDYAQGELRPLREEDEFEAFCDALGLSPSDESPLVAELRELVRLTWAELNDPASAAKFLGDLPPEKPMMSLRDVETQVTVRSQL